MGFPLMGELMAVGIGFVFWGIASGGGMCCWDSCCAGGASTMVIILGENTARRDEADAIWGLEGSRQLSGLKWAARKVGARGRRDGHERRMRKDEKEKEK